MDFLFYKFLNHNNVAQAKLNIDLCEDQQVHCGLNYVSAYRPSTNRILNDSTGLLLSGHIQYKTYNRSHSLEILDEHLNNGEWPLSDLFSGFFSGVQFSDDIIRIFNDPIGLFHLYYCITSNFIVVATNLNAIYSITGSTMRRSALLLEMTGPEFSQYGRSTVLENVFTLMPGEMLVFRNGKTERFFDTTIKIEDKPGRKNLAYELVDLINSEFKSFYQEDNELMVSMSGGIDSRVNLAALLANGKKPLLSNFGKPEYIDSKIPLKIACQIKLPIDIIDSVSYQFPPQAVIDKIVKETDSLYINQWLSLFDYYREKLPPYSFFLLGDMCDILRAKGISTLKTRNFRLNHYIKKFFTGSQLTLLPISEERKKRFKLDKRDKILRQVIEAANVYFGEKRNDSLVDEVESDINELFNHLDLYAASFIESYEELFGIFTHGRRSMGKQLNILKVAFTPEIPILNLRIIRNVLNFNPVVRYGDELTNQMFKHPTWNQLGKYPTAQNPFVPYNSNFWLMMLGWFVRSSTDQALLKLYVLTKGKFNRKRLVKSRDILSEYMHPGAIENYAQYFSGIEINALKLLRIFEDRANKKAWPLSGQDLIPYAQAAWYLKNFRH